MAVQLKKGQKYLIKVLKHSKPEYVGVNMKAVYKGVAVEARFSLLYTHEIILASQCEVIKPL
jgi:hypothetical protein